MLALTAFIENRNLASGTKARINRQHGFVLERRLKQQASQVSGEDANCVFFCLLSNFPADLAFDAGVDESVELILNAIVQKLAMHMTGKAVRI